MTAPANFITFLGGSIFRNGRKTIQVIVTVINIMNRFSAFFKSESYTISGKAICICFKITCGGYKASPSKEGLVKTIFLTQYSILSFLNKIVFHQLDILNNLSEVFLHHNFQE